MSLRFEEQLQRIIEKVAQEGRFQAQRDVASVLPTGGRSSKRLFEMIQDPAVSEDIRCTACWIAGRLGNIRAEKALLVALVAGPPMLRKQAATALGELQRIIPSAPNRNSTTKPAAVERSDRWTIPQYYFTCVFPSIPFYSDKIWYSMIDAGITRSRLMTGIFLEP